MSIKILLADDSITIQKVVGIIFGVDEYALTVVDNGKDALDKALEIVPDVLLIDAVMPGMSGFEVCEAVRKSPTLSAKPILLLTGSFEPFDEDKAKNCGADDFIAKPFESQQIVAKVKELYALGTSRISAAAPVQPDVAIPAFQAPAEPAFPETPAFPPPAAPVESSEPGDIWKAFMPTAEPAAATAATVSEVAPAGPGSDFTVVDQEHGAEFFQPRQAVTTQWAPIDEQSFEFATEPFAETPAPASSEPSPPVHEFAFGNVAPAESAHEEEPNQAPPNVSFADEPFLAPPPPPAAEGGAPTAAAALSEEQLRAAIAGISREVIERIVWEVVPDLAETMIKDAILKIQEGR